jgi:hypothetical protein
MLELEEAKLRVQKVADGIAKGKFDAEPQVSLLVCPYRNLCPATEKVGRKMVLAERSRVGSINDRRLPIAMKVYAQCRKKKTLGTLIASPLSLPVAVA